MFGNSVHEVVTVDTDIERWKMMDIRGETDEMMEEETVGKYLTFFEH